MIKLTYMKKLFFFFCLLCSTILVNAQNKVIFKMQSDASLKSEDGKDYIVVPFAGKSSQELFSMVNINVTTQYVSAKNVLSSVENEVISINGVGEGKIEKEKKTNAHFKQRQPVSPENTSYSFTFQYVLNFRFKDGKIRIDAPVIIGYSDSKEINDPIVLWVKRKGVDKEKVYKEIESILNELCDKLISAKKVEEDW